MIRPLIKPIDEWENAIIQSAQALFIENGYEKTSINSIMKRVGAAKGSFYRHFDSKEDVLGAIVDDWAGRYAQGIIEILSDDGIVIEQKLSGILEVVGRMAKQPDGTEAFFSGTDKTLALGLQNKMVGILAPELSAALELAKSRGEIEVANPYFCSLFIIYGSLGVLNAGDDLLSDDAIEELRTIVANILGLNGEG